MKELISKFHGLVLTAGEYAAIEDYLFGTGIRPPLADEGVLDTVDYLKDMCVRSGYRSLQELQGYYDEQHANLDRMIDQIKKQENN